MDVTNVFKASVKTVQMRSKLDKKDSEQEEKKPRHRILQSRKHRSAFIQQTRQVLGDLRDLAKFLEKTENPYYDLGLRPGFNAGGMTNAEVREFEEDTAQVLLACDSIMKDVLQVHKTAGGSLQAEEHRQAVINCLNMEVIATTKRFQQMRNQRLKLKEEKERICSLSDLSKPRKPIVLSADATANEISQSKAKVGSFFMDEDTEENPVLSPEEEHLLAQENRTLMADFNTMEEEIHHIGQKVAGIVELQEMFTEKVLSQEKDLLNIQTTVVGTTENLVSGNQQIREAMKRNAGFRVWVMFVLLVISFALLFLDWYNP